MLKKLRLGMVGGGQGAMIGNIHRYAASIDNQYELIGGVFSRSYDNTLAMGRALGLEKQHLYKSHLEMFATEEKQDDDNRMDVVTIVTPNDSHFEIAKEALRHGFHVIIDKPLTIYVSEAIELVRIAKKMKKLACVTYVYTGYPMIKEARHLLTTYALGSIRKIMVEFSQGWLSKPLETTADRQANWRMDPERNVSGTVADIGTHAFHLAEYVSGLQVTHVSAKLNKHFNHRGLEDDSAIHLKFDQNVHGSLVASQISAGDEADLTLRVYTDKGSLHWQHRSQDILTIKWLDKPTEILRAGSNNEYLHPITRYNCRTPAGHPEGYIEAFANLYRNFACWVKSDKYQKEFNPVWHDYPTLEEGLRGVMFIEKALVSHDLKGQWQPFD